MITDFTAVVFDVMLWYCENMNLILLGKRKCIKDAAHILRVLSDLLGHENQEVKIHGCRPLLNMYSVIVTLHLFQLLEANQIDYEALQSSLLLVVSFFYPYLCTKHNICLSS